MIKYKGYTFDTIRNFDCINLDFENKKGGGFFTHLPISGREYREEQLKRRRVMPDKVEVKVLSKTTKFIITDDWGTKYLVSLTNDHKQEIEYAINKAKEYGLLV